MAFDATTPYALACLSDTAKARQSYTVLQQQEPVEIRAQNLVELVHGWDIPMAEQEAKQVIAEFDSVTKAHAASGRGPGSFHMTASFFS
jgi:hypothetical protein